MNIRRLQAEIRAQSKLGDSPRQIFHSYAQRYDEESVAALLSGIPVPEAMHYYRWGNVFLIVCFSVLLMIAGIDLLVLAPNGEGWPARCGFFVATLGIVYGLSRKRYWAYVGVPFLVLLWFLADLSEVSISDGPAMLFALLVFYAPGVLCAWIAWRIRKSAFPFAGLMGPRRNNDGTLTILQELRSSSEDSGV